MLADLNVVFVTPRGSRREIHKAAISPEGEFAFCALHPALEERFDEQIRRELPAFLSSWAGSQEGDFARLGQSARRWLLMSWMKREPPGDPEYCCDCPPCPFCFVWVEESNQDQPRGKRRGLTRVQPFVLPLLAIIAFALTIGITMRHESLRSAANEIVSTATSLPLRVRIPSVVHPAVSESASAVPAASSADPAAPVKPALPAMPASEPPPQEVPVAVVFSPTSAGGLYAVLENQSTEPLLVMMTISDRKGGHKYTTTLTVPPYSTAQLDGIAAERGDRITLASNGYRDQVTYFP